MKGEQKVDKMTRKDTILIAVIVNAGLLAVLFVTAVMYDTGSRDEQIELVTPLVDDKNSQIEQESSLVVASSLGDEVDHVLKYYSQPTDQPIVGETQQEVPEPIAVQSNAPDDEYLRQELSFDDQERFVEVTVKKGDVLEKIAKANGTTVAAIKRVNQLQSERLSIGQVLKIPVKNRREMAVLAESSGPVKKPREVAESTEGVYYVVKNGDNPWKIAKQFNVKSEDIVRLNHLDEDKARNLKVGERIRVK